MKASSPNGEHATGTSIMSTSLDEDAHLQASDLISQPLNDRSSPDSSTSSSLSLTSQFNDGKTQRSGISTAIIGLDYIDNGRTGTRAQETVSPQTYPQFPHLFNNPPTSNPTSPGAKAEGQDEEPAVANVFERTSSPNSAMMRNRGAAYEKVGEEGICKMHKFSLYETASRFFLVGADTMDRKFRILKIDRTAESGDLCLAEDDIIYTKKEMNQLLNAIDDGNKSSGGLKLRSSTWGLLGFIKFTGEYYMLLITKRSQVAMIGGHYVYQIDGTELISLTSPSSTRFKPDRHPEETRFVSILNNVDLSRSFYFSYSYDITHTLQYNILRERSALLSGILTASGTSEHTYNNMFIWNHHLLKPAVSALRNTYDWCLPIMHGFVDQASIKFFFSIRSLC